ncbi:MAG: hypothetical protein OEQ28_04850 [Acidobacteriota bacterium]|nr:hypothetical protein [Acidobacteriota bacterium]
MGKKIAEYSTSLSQNPRVHYGTEDHLGSPRLLTDRDGKVISRRDFYPFGEDLNSSERASDLGYRPDEVKERFTRYENDEEIDLEFAQARYYSNEIGRFTTVDPLRKSATIEDPQSWNRFAYVLNRVTIATDPDGLSTIIVIVEEQSGNSPPKAEVSFVTGNGTAFDSGMSALAAGRMSGGQRTRTVTNGDTPFGVYRNGGLEGGEPSDRLGRGWGTGRIRMSNVSGEAVTHGRFGFYIHGGGSGLRSPYALDQPLRATLGCVKVSNRDVNRLIMYAKLFAQGDDPLDRMFVGTVASLKQLAEKKDGSGNYLYPDLRLSLWTQGHLELTAEEREELIKADKERRKKKKKKKRSREEEEEE